MPYKISTPRQIGVPYAFHSNPPDLGNACTGMQELRANSSWTYLRLGIIGRVTWEGNSLL